MPSNHGRELAVRRSREADQQTQAKDAQGKIHTVYGSIELGAPSDVVASINFPVKFIERPVSNFGGQLKKGYVESGGAFPQIDAIVLEWVTEELEGHSEVGPQVHYTGAKLGISATGSDSHEFYLDFTFDGMALVNPVGGVESDELDDEL